MNLRRTKSNNSSITEIDSRDEESKRGSSLESSKSSKSRNQEHQVPVQNSAQDNPFCVGFEGYSEVDRNQSDSYSEINSPEWMKKRTGPKLKIGKLGKESASNACDEDQESHTLLDDEDLDREEIPMGRVSELNKPFEMPFGLNLQLPMPQLKKWQSTSVPKLTNLGKWKH